MTKYPLTWPTGWKRIAPHRRTRAKFHATSRTYQGDNSWLKKRELSVAEATSRVLEELHRFGVRHSSAIISTNLVLRLDGLPRSDQRVPADPGVAVYWQRPADKSMKCMAIDLYDRVADNLAAVAATLDAMRAIERHGGAQILERAFTGFTALPAPGQTAGRGWRDVLDVGAGATLTEAEQQYRKLRSTNHPDRGGDPVLFHEVENAWQQARTELLNG